MSTEPVILDFRLSFVWTETLLGLLDGTLEPKPSFEFLTLSSSYKQLFEAIQKPGATAALNVPWRESRQHFWNFYLPGSVGKPVGGKQAWEHLVPLRAKPPLTLDKWSKGQIVAEGFYYPHGTAVVCTFRCQGRYKPEQVQELAYAIRYDERFIATADGKQQQLSLNKLAGLARNLLRAQAVKPGDTPGLAKDDPFTLMTVIKGEGVAPEQPIPTDEKNPVWRMLGVLAWWPTNPVAATVADFVRMPLTLKKGAAKGSAAIAGPRGSTAWLPDLFTVQKPKKPSLACYHRNRLMGAMQVESLGALVAAVAADLRAGMELKDFTSSRKTRARNACECLEGLLGGDKDQTYRSDTFRRHIDDNYLKALNELRGAFSPGIADLG